MPYFVRTVTYRDDVLVSDVTTEITDPTQVAELDYTSNIQAEFAQFKTALDALTAVPNNAFTGSAQVKDFARATRRMIRAISRDLKAIDNGA